MGCGLLKGGAVLTDEVLLAGAKRDADGFFWQDNSYGFSGLEKAVAWLARLRLG